MHESAPALPPHVVLIQMCGGAWVASAIHAAAKHALADHLADGPRTADDVAEVTGLHAPTLYRFLRSLAGLGLFTQDDAGRFGLTPLGAALRSGAPGEARSTALAFLGPAFSRSWEHLTHTLETGQPAFDKAWGTGVFDYMARDQELASLFSQAMVGFHGAEPPTVAEAYDFSGVRTVVDVGGATGNMLAAILSRHPGVRGVLFDQAHVVADASALLEGRGVADRVTIQAGSFFEGVPSGGDVYILSHIIHDWTEEQCLTILQHCRDAMNPGGRILIVETVLPEGDTPHQGKLQDLVMMAIPGGQERTEAEYATLLGKAGLRLQQVVPTTSVVSVVEAVAE